MNSRISRLIKIAPSLGVVAVLPLLAACNERAASASAQLERPVQVQRVDFTNENPAREFVGVVRARQARLARALVAERTARKPASRLNQLLKQRVGTNPREHEWRAGNAVALLA